MRPFIEGIKNENCLLVQEWLQVPAVHGSSSGLQPVEPAELWPLLLSASPSPNAPPPPLLASSPALTPELCESVPLALQNRHTHVWKNLMKKLVTHQHVTPGLAQIDPSLWHERLVIYRCDDRTFLCSLRLLLDLPQPLHQLILLSLYSLLFFLSVLSPFLLVLQLRPDVTKTVTVVSHPLLWLVTFQTLFHGVFVSSFNEKKKYLRD